MKQVAFFKVRGSYWDDKSDFLEGLCSFEDVSDEDYNDLILAISRQSCYESRYIMVEKSNLNEFKETFHSVLEKLKKQALAIKENEALVKRKAEKRLATLKKNREEKERAQLEELKKKYDV